MNSLYPLSPLPIPSLFHQSQPRFPDALQLVWKEMEKYANVVSQFCDSVSEQVLKPLEKFFKEGESRRKKIGSEYGKIDSHLGKVCVSLCVSVCVQSLEYLIVCLPLLFLLFVFVSRSHHHWPRKGNRV